MRVAVSVHSGRPAAAEAPMPGRTDIVLGRG